MTGKSLAKILHTIDKEGYSDHSEISEYPENSNTSSKSQSWARSALQVRKRTPTHKKARPSKTALVQRQLPIARRSNYC